MDTNERIAPPAVVMYSSGWCPYCMRARALFERKGIALMEIKVDEQPQERDTMLARSGGRRTVPQIFVGDRHVVASTTYALTRRRFDKLLGRADRRSQPQTIWP
jgi:glutaredoxin 3